jgi:uncharacterized membrane protein YdfJ with MMPL/SSD domain
MINIKQIKEIFKDKEWSDRDYFFILFGAIMASFVLLMLLWLGVH